VSNYARHEFPRTFVGLRATPPESYKATAITNFGAGPDYEGAVYTDGTVVIRWLTEFRSHSVWSCWNDFWHVHGHPEYGTRIYFSDDGPPPSLTCGH
jgi:hypothetical protein